MAINMQNGAVPDSQEALPHGSFGKSALYAFVAVLAVYALAILGGNDANGIKNSDDIMRLVTLRDLVAGQSWFDPFQYRLGLDGGTLMHWSRLVDGPLWLIYSIAELFTGDIIVAEQITAFIWPALTLFIAVFAVNIACARMGYVSAQIPATIFGAAAFMTSGIFSPGALDHHNIQVALCMVLVAMLVPGRFEGRAHALAGVIAVLMLAIGVETLPYVTIAGVWVTAAFLTGIIHARSAFMFGIWLGVSALLVYLATIQPQDYGAVYCDAYSAFHIGMCSVGGFALAITAHFSATTKARFFVLGLAAGAAIVLMLVVFPQCLSNPLASLDPKLKIFWLDGVVETRSVLDLWAADPYQLFGLLGMAVCGMLASLWLVFKSEEKAMRWFGVLSLMLITMAIGVTLWQQRGTLFASALAVLPLSFVFARLRSKYLHTNTARDLLKMTAMGVLSLNIFWWVAGAQASVLFAGQQTLQEQARNVSARDYCFSEDVFAPLAKEPAGVVLGATDIGANILKLTNHRALAGPYHRNTDGNLQMIETMLAAPDNAYVLLNEAGVTLIADCINSADANDFKKAAPNGLQAKLHQGEVPSWLEKVPETADAPLVIYRVKPKL